MGGSEQRARELLGVRVRVGFKKQDFEGPANGEERKAVPAEPQEQRQEDGS